MINFSYKVFDTESTKIPRHTPWHPDSYLCSVGVVDNDNTDKAWFFNHVSEPVRDHREMVDAIQEAYLIAKKNNKKYTPKKYRKDE